MEILMVLAVGGFLFLAGWFLVICFLAIAPAVLIWSGNEVAQSFLAIRKQLEWVPRWAWIGIGAALLAGAIAWCASQ
jgi:hypothetical protein